MSINQSINQSIHQGSTLLRNLVQQSVNQSIDQALTGSFLFCYGEWKYPMLIFPVGGAKSCHVWPIGGAGCVISVFLFKYTYNLLKYRTFPKKLVPTKFQKKIEARIFCHFFHQRPLSTECRMTSITGTELRSIRYETRPIERKNKPDWWVMHAWHCRGLVQIPQQKILAR